MFVRIAIDAYCLLRTVCVRARLCVCRTAEWRKRKRMNGTVIVRKYAQQVTLNVHNVRHLVQLKTYSHRIHFLRCRDFILFFGSIESKKIRVRRHSAISV